MGLAWGDGGALGLMQSLSLVEPEPELVPVPVPVPERAGCGPVGVEKCRLDPWRRSKNERVGGRRLQAADEGLIVESWNRGIVESWNNLAPTSRA